MLVQTKVSKLQDVMSLSARLLRRRFPDFVYGGALSGIPVFCFHEIEPVRFERQLQFLRRNGYRTLTCDGFYQRVTRAHPTTFEAGPATEPRHPAQLGGRDRAPAAPGIPRPPRWRPLQECREPRGDRPASGVTRSEDVGVDSREQGVDSDEKAVLLTFDDGLGSLWSVGLPLLKRYEMTVTLFLATGRVTEGGCGPTLEDLRQGRADAASVLRRDLRPSPFVTWDEVRALHDSGLVDIQAHSVTHSRIFVGPDIEDFVRPSLLRRVSATKLPEWTPERMEPGAWGRPIYQAAPRLSDCRRYIEDPSLRQACETYVAERGGAAFFNQTDWRQELERCVGRYRSAHPHRSRYETDEERRQAVWYELAESKRMIEARLPGKIVRHFCYPWDEGSPLAMELSRQAGYVTNFVKQVAGRDMGVTPGAPTLVSRFSDDWLFTLPGEGRRSCWHPVRAKLVRWGSLPFRDGTRSRIAHSAPGVTT